MPTCGVAWSLPAGRALLAIKLDYPCRILISCGGRASYPLSGTAARDVLSDLRGVKRG